MNLCLATDFRFQLCAFCNCPLLSKLISYTKKKVVCTFDGALFFSYLERNFSSEVHVESYLAFGDFLHSNVQAYLWTVSLWWR